MSLNRRAFLSGISGAAAAALLARITKAQENRRLNVLIIVSDDHACRAMSCYGGSLNQTPHLDKLAAEGMRFTQSFVTNSLCGPSRATLLTGKYSHGNGFYDNESKKPFDGYQQTLPKLLQTAGYETAIFGKWHLVSEPVGFDHWKLINGGYVNAKFFDRTGPLDLKGYSLDLTTDMAIDYLRNRDAGRPFFLQVGYVSPHRNWVPDEKRATMYEDTDFPLPATFDDDFATRSDAARKCRMSIEKDLIKRDLKVAPPPGLQGAELKRWKYQRLMQDYLRTVAAMDENIGRLMKHLDESGLSENTLVIYTSDNGFFMGEHGWYDKRFMYEPSIRVPLIARLPGVIKPGTTSDKMVINTDWMPTILDFAGVKIPDDLHGASLKPILSGKDVPDWRRSFYYHYYELNASEHNVQPHYGVRTERYKLIYFYQLDAWEMYDLQKDPDEIRNVFDDPGYAEPRGKLLAELERLRAELKDTTP